MTTLEDNHVTLTLEGTRARRGVSLSDFESFIRSFLGALRDYDRARRGAATRKPGRIERRAQAATAFRLVQFAPGSGVATVEAERLAAPEDDELPIGDLPLALENLRALADDLETPGALPNDVASTLEDACRAMGSDGSIAIDFPAHVRASPAVVDLPNLARSARPPQAAGEAEVRTVSGRLHYLDVEPDKLAIRTTAGIDWMCKYPPELEAKITTLVDRVVWAEGAGHMSSAQRGSMSIERIELAEEREQSALFTDEAVPDAVLLASQGIGGPQGLARFADPEWDAETDDVYLEALTDR